jgi:hypothetical protein
VLDAFLNGDKPKPGPQSGRRTSENSAGMTALTSQVSAEYTLPFYQISAHKSVLAVWSGGILCPRVQVDLFNILPSKRAPMQNKLHSRGLKYTDVFVILPVYAHPWSVLLWNLIIPLTIIVPENPFAALWQPCNQVPVS